MKAIRSVRLVLGLALLLILCVGCKPSAERESKPSADWSRGVAVGQYASGSVGIYVDGAGERIHMVWPSDLGEGAFIRYVSLDEQASQISTQELKFAGLLRAPRLAPAGDGRLHLFWASRPAGGKMWSIWHTLLEPGGGAIGSPNQVSAPERSAGAYEISADASGNIAVVWDSGSLGEIHLRRLSADGSFAGDAQVIAERGEMPSVWTESNGTLHLAWLGEGALYYASLLPGGETRQKGLPVVDVNLGTGQSLVGPYLGVAGEWIYLFWSMLNQSGLEAGTGYSSYVAFPAQAPAMTPARRILMLPSEVQSYQAYRGELALTQLVPPVEQAWASSDFILHPGVMQGYQGGELAVAMALNQQLRQDEQLQIAVAVFRDGQMAGYTVGTKTEGISDYPALFVDTARHLHLAWREGAGGRKVYYATTQPEAVAALDRLNAGDIANAILEGSVESFVSIALLPVIGFGWILPGMLIVGVWKLVRDDDSLAKWHSWVPLSIAILLFYIVKLTTLPTIVTYIPFSAWLDLPAWLGAPLRFAVPLLIFTAAFIAANRLRKRHSASAARFYIVFTLSDALLTLAIYGVNFLGVN